MPEQNISRPNKQRAHLFPEIEPFRKGFLDSGDGHKVYYEECGNPNGIPVLVSKACPWIQLESYHAGYRLPFKKSIFLEKLKKIEKKINNAKIKFARGPPKTIKAL